VSLIATESANDSADAAATPSITVRRMIQRRSSRWPCRRARRPGGEQHDQQREEHGELELDAEHPGVEQRVLAALK